MKKLAYCGDDCSCCPRYIGTINDDVEVLKKAAEIWYKMGFRDRILSPDAIKCSGCLSVRECTYGIKECCKKKKIDNCGYCTEMPCDKLKEMFKRAKKYKKISKALLAKEEYEMLNTAFWMKEKYLKRIRNERNKR